METIETDRYKVYINYEKEAIGIEDSNTGKNLILADGDYDPFLDAHFEAVFNKNQKETDELFEKIVEDLGYVRGDWK